MSVKKKSPEKYIKHRKKILEKQEEAIHQNVQMQTEDIFQRRFTDFVSIITRELNTMSRFERRAILETIMRIFNEGYIEWEEDYDPLRGS